MAVGVHGDSMIPPPDPADEQRAKAIVASSRIVQWLDRLIDVPGHAWETSRLRRLLQPTMHHIAESGSAEQLRLVASVVVVATIVHILLYLAFAGAVGWPTWSAWTVFLLAATVVAARPREVIAAWNESTVRGWMARRRKR